MQTLHRVRDQLVGERTALTNQIRSGYGVSASFRHGLVARGLRWAVGIVQNQKVYAADVRLVPPTGHPQALAGPGAA